MLNEERVKMMMKLASYEEGQGKEDFKVNSYYRKDYVSFRTIVTLIWTTIGYGLAVGLFFLVNLERIFEDLTLAKFFLLGVLVVIGYIAVLIIYGMMAGGYYKKKHNEAKLRVKRYYRNLSRLSKMYKKENM